MRSQARASYDGQAFDRMDHMFCFKSSDATQHGRTARLLFIPRYAEPCGEVTSSARVSSTLRLVKEAQNLSSDVFSPRLLVIHDASRRGEDDVAELTRRQKLDDPLLHVTELDVVAGADDARLVKAAVELDNDLAVPVVVDLLELANVACNVESADVARD